MSAEVQHALLTLNARLAPSPARAAHLAALGQPGTICVVTGQQVGLFLGPLYTIYKAAAAIATARALEAETGRPAVPVFWLQSEDHDFDEVATAYIPRGAEAPLALTAAGESDSRVSMSHRRFGPDVTSLLEQLSESLGTLPHAAETRELFGQHYRPDAGWVDAFADLVGALFAEEGLVLFNPRTVDLAGPAARFHRHGVAEATRIADGLLRQHQELIDAGFSAPVHIRPGAPLCFFHPDGADGARYRLVPDGDGWCLVGTERRLTNLQLAHALESDPLCFSTSALLRPVLQDSLLPTAAYVGGPGEIDYFAQIAPVYEAFDLPLPLLVPRARYAVVDPKQQKALDELGLSVEALAQPEAALLDEVADRPSHLLDPDLLQERLLGTIRGELSGLAPQLDGLQTGLKKAADKTLDSVERACSKFVDKYRGALNQADTHRVDALRRLKTVLCPLDAPQERIHSLPYYAARYGARPFVAEVVARCRPYHSALEVIAP